MKENNEELRYPSSQPIKYALELNKDWFAKKNIKKGALLSLEGLNSPSP